ncbi:MAG: esterase family protein [Ruminococcaceae bacterium]|nr:esterase family protein [Oscillospiraceae bacterium]
MFLEMNLKSAELNRQTQVYVLLPDDNDAPCKVLWLLHGLSDNHTGWMRYTAIERYARKHRLAVVMPNVDRSWYTDTAYGANYFSFVTKELPEVCFKTFRQMSRKREDNIVAGLSMGGYGAIKAALCCPEQYDACISLSGSLDITRKGRPCNLNEWQSIFGFDMKDPLELEGSRHDLFALAEKAKSEGKQLPRLYLWCGTEDHLIEINRTFDRHLTELGIDHKFETSEGDHSWKWWDLHIQSALEWALCD